MDRVNLILQNSEYQMLLAEIEEAEKDRIYCLHGFTHAIDVARVGYILSLEEKLPIKKDMIYAAALLHDMGRASEYKYGKDHREESVIFAEKILPLCGFLPDEQAEIKKAIQAHSGYGEDGLASVLQRADKLSRMCFYCKSRPTCKWSDEKKNMCIIY